MQMPVPSKEQEQLMEAMGIDHRQYGVQVAGEDFLHIKHYKTGNELTIRVNGRCGLDHRT